MANMDRLSICSPCFAITFSNAHLIKKYKSRQLHTCLYGRRFTDNGDLSLSQKHSYHSPNLFFSRLQSAFLGLATQIASWLPILQIVSSTLRVSRQGTSLQLPGRVRVRVTRFCRTRRDGNINTSAPRARRSVAMQESPRRSVGISPLASCRGVCVCVTVRRTRCFLRLRRFI